MGEACYSLRGGRATEERSVAEVLCFEAQNFLAASLCHKPLVLAACLSVMDSNMYDMKKQPAMSHPVPTAHMHPVACCYLEAS